MNSMKKNKKISVHKNIIMIGSLVIAMAGVSADDPQDISKSAKEKIQNIKSEAERRRLELLASFSEFQAEVIKNRPGLRLQMPVEPDIKKVSGFKSHGNLPGEPETPLVFAIVKEDVSLKAWHSEDEKIIIDKVQKGEKVEVMLVIQDPDKPDFVKWAMVRKSNESQGYLKLDQLQNSAEDVPDHTKKKEKKYVTVNTGLRMRARPALDGLFLKLVPYDTEVMVDKYSSTKDTVNGITDVWAQITYEGEKGWVFNGFLKPTRLKPEPVVPVVIKPDIKPVKKPTGKFVVPVQGRISSPFGPRIDPVTKKKGSYHRGIDIVAKTGTPIMAAKEGKVITREFNKAYGNYVILDHGDKVYTYYCHQSKFNTVKNAKVNAGDVIGYVGKTGKATGPHLHFEVRVGNDPRDPLTYVDMKKK